MRVSVCLFHMVKLVYLSGKRSECERRKQFASLNVDCVYVCVYMCVCIHALFCDKLT